MSWNGDDRFPMASVYKLPIAVAFLQRVDEGAASLQDSITIAPSDFVGGARPMTAGAGDYPVTLDIGRVLAYMVTESDNTASDEIMRRAGGPTEVRRRLAALGIEGLDVSRYEAEIFEEMRRRGGPVRDPGDLRDTASPEALTSLLALLQRGMGLSAASRRLLLDLLTATTIGPGRLRGLLPPETPVAHKTGTHGAATNDVGIVTLPDGSHVAIAVLIEGSGGDEAAREAVIAEIGRLVYDEFVADRP